MSENCCSGGTILVYPCSGAADVGLVSDRAARELRGRGFAMMSCLAGVGAGLSGYVESARGADTVITIDGCPVSCARKVIEKTGVTPRSYIVTEMGHEKNKTEVTDAVIDDVCNKIADPLSKPVVYSQSGGCGCGGKC